MEGVGFGLRDAADLIRSVSPVDEIRVSGGGAASPVWMQILADVLGSPVRPVGTPESAAHGAALLAATGVGLFPSVHAATDAAVVVGAPVEPGADAARYDEAIGVYRDLYPALSGSFADLAALDA
jgi:xylulokinase